MMVSLESRAVFWDNEVVEFCRRLPSRFKFYKGNRKRTLKEAVRALVRTRSWLAARRGSVFRWQLGYAPRSHPEPFQVRDPRCSQCAGANTVAAKPIISFCCETAGAPHPSHQRGKSLMESPRTSLRPKSESVIYVYLFCIDPGCK
jgi:hypothetical protein